MSHAATGHPEPIPLPITLDDLSESDESAASTKSAESDHPNGSDSILSASVTDPGQFDPAAPPEVIRDRLYPFIVGRWVIPNTGPANTQHVVYPYSDAGGHITYRMQAFDENRNPR
jgi:hypothetical protein